MLYLADGSDFKSSRAKRAIAAENFLTPAHSRYTDEYSLKKTGM
jgi:hypothetical protein